MQTELKSDAARAAPDEVGTVQPKRWRGIAREWVGNCLAEPSSVESQAKSSTKQRLHFLTACVVIFFTAFGVRLLQWQDMRVETLQEDSIATTLVHLYELETKRMEEDGGVLFPREPVDPDDARLLIHPPGYSILLGALYGTEHTDNHYFALRMIQVLCDVLSVLILFLIAAEFFPLALSLLAGLLAALSPHHAYYSLWLSPDSLVVLPILLGVLFFIKASKRPRFGAIFAAGIFFGLACWLRANPLLLAPMFAAITFVVFERGKRLRSAVVLLLAMLAVLAPITIRNWVIYHRFIPLTIVTGLNLIQGLAEFDKEDRFGLPLMDAEARIKDAEWHNRPDYERSLWFPDGIERDQYRFKRGLEVIGANPGWFAKVVLSRMAFMLRYNDFRPQNNDVFTSIAPTVLPAPNFGHQISGTEKMKRTDASYPSDWLANPENRASQAETSMESSGRLHLIGDDTEYGTQISSPPIAVKKNTDYVIKIPVHLQQGRLSVKITTPTPNEVLAIQHLLPDKIRKAKKKLLADRESNAETPADSPDKDSLQTEPAMNNLELAFASGTNESARIVFSNDGESSTRSMMKIGAAEIFELGATPYQWTRLPRSIARGLQKNIFKTDTMRLLILLGIVLLALARRRNALLILLAVPVYYLTTHAAFSTECRYILALHFSLCVFAATTLTVAGAAIAQGTVTFINRKRARTGEDDHLATPQPG
jgi:hypothetical protein